MKHQSCAAPNNSSKNWHCSCGFSYFSKVDLDRHLELSNKLQVNCLMNGDQFYQEFKNALDYFGLSWGEKNKVIVSFYDNCICLKYGIKRVMIGGKE